MLRLFTVCVALWGVCVLFVRCQNLSAEFKKHSSMASKSNFPCRLPQPRVFYLEELVNATEWSTKYQNLYNMDMIKPKWTVLYRCTCTGGCENQDQRCLPSAVEDVKMTFRNDTERLTYFQIPVTNHTECGCLSTDSSGKGNIK